MQAQAGRIFIGRFEKDSDLLASWDELCRRESILSGVFSLIGSVSCSRFGYYNQVTHKYIEMQTDERSEIIHCSGNISMKEGEIFVHAHVLFADDKGKCFGGHLLPGTRIFAAEYYLQELKDALLVRQPDAQTGLSLWS